MCLLITNFFLCFQRAADRLAANMTMDPIISNGTLPLSQNGVASPQTNMGGPQTRVDVPQASSIGFSESASRRSSLSLSYGLDDYTILIAKANKDIKMNAELADMSFSQAQTATNANCKSELIAKAKSCVSSGLTAKEYLQQLKHAQLTHSREALDQPDTPSPLPPAAYAWNHVSW